MIGSHVDLPSGGHIKQDRDGGAANPDRQLVADHSAAAVGENGWAISAALPVLLAAVGGEPFDGAAVWKHGATDRHAALVDRIEGCVERDRVQGGGDGEVSGKS